MPNFNAAEKPGEFSSGFSVFQKENVMKPFVTALIVAAGNSTRMKVGKNKLLLTLGGLPIIARTLLAFERSDCIHEIVLVCRREDRSVFLEIAQDFSIRKLKAVADGGQTRQQSVFAGIQAAAKEATHFAIHDGARALITGDGIEASVKDGLLLGASALGVPVKDTIKVIDPKGYVLDTPDRSLLWSVQTPQVFERKLYERAMESALREQADYTDDCQLVEKLGIKVHLCMGAYENIKITTKDDLALGEYILALKENSL